MSPPKDTKENRIQEALKANEADPGLSLRKLSQMFQIPKSTLHNRISQTSTPRKAAHESQQLLSKAEEVALTSWIKKWDDYGFPTRRRHVYQMVQSLLRDRNCSDQVGEHWLNRFLGRHPDLDSKVGRCLDKERALATDLDSFKKHLDRFYHIRCRFHVRDEDTWNTDEKGFAIGLGGAGTLIGRASRRNPSLIQDGGRDWITVVEAISGGAKVLPPLIIFKANAHLIGHHTNIEIEEKEDAFFATSAKGYTNAQITFKWFQEIFEQRTRTVNGINQHWILVLDGHSTHVENYEFIQHAIDHNIHLICLPSHSTHILQPLDVGIFSPVSTYYRQELEDCVRQQGPYGTIKKTDVFPLLQRARLKTFQPEIILSAWRACGLILFNRNRILRDPVLQAKMVSKTPLATRRPGLRPASHRIEGAPELDQIKLSNEQIPETPENKAVKDLLTQCIKQARILNAARVIADEEVTKVRQLVKPAKADRRQLGGGLLLSSKHLAKLYHKRMALDKKKAEASMKRKVTKALAKRQTQSKGRKGRRTHVESDEGAMASSIDSEESESGSDEEAVENQLVYSTQKVCILLVKSCLY